MVLWLSLCASSEGGAGSIPGQGTEIPLAVGCSQKDEGGKVALACGLPGSGSEQKRLLPFQSRLLCSVLHLLRCI